MATGWRERLLIGLLVVVGGSCRSTPQASSRGSKEAPDSAMGVAEVAADVMSDALGSLPTFLVSRADEIVLTGAPIAAETLLVRKDGIQIHTKDGQVGFSKTGQRGATTDGGSSGYPATGVDGFISENGTFVMAIVSGPALVWVGWEISGTTLEGIQSGTGLGLGTNRALCDGCLYVSDGPAQSVKEYGEGGDFRRELALPGTDPQGVAVSGSGKVYVADAKGRRLLRIDSRLEKIEAVAALPAGAGGKVPTGLDFDDEGLLYVCFRDKNVLLVLQVPDGG